MNPSWLAAKVLHNTIHKIPQPSGGTAEKQQIHITALEIPTVYDSVLQTVPGLHAKPPVLPPAADSAFAPAHLPSGGFDFILHVGVAGPGGVSLEQLGHKLGYNSADAEGKYAPVVSGTANGETQPVRGFGKGYEGMPEEIHTDIDIAELKEHLQENGIEVCSPARGPCRPYSLSSQRVVWSRDAGHYLCDFTYYASLAEAKRCVIEQAKATPVLFLHCCPEGEPYEIEVITDAIQKIVVWVGSRISS